MLWSVFCIYPSVVRGFVDNLAQILQESLGTRRVELLCGVVADQLWAVCSTRRWGRPSGLWSPLQHCPVVLAGSPSSLPSLWVPLERWTGQQIAKCCKNWESPLFSLSCVIAKQIWNRKCWGCFYGMEFEIELVLSSQMGHLIFSMILYWLCFPQNITLVFTLWFKKKRIPSKRIHKSPLHLLFSSCSQVNLQ